MIIKNLYYILRDLSMLVMIILAPICMIISTLCAMCIRTHTKKIHKLLQDKKYQYILQDKKYQDSFLQIKSEEDTSQTVETQTE